MDQLTTDTGHFVNSRAKQETNMWSSSIKESRNDTWSVNIRVSVLKRRTSEDSSIICKNCFDKGVACVSLLQQSDKPHGL